METISIKQLKEMINSLPESVIEKGTTNLIRGEIIFEATLCPKIKFETVSTR